MKRKLLAGFIALAMILSVGTLMVAAAPATWVTGEDSFRPVGDVRIEWDPLASEKLDLSDGRMGDWAAAGYSPTVINPENLVSWVGTTADNMPAGFNISSYFVADKDYLYIGFYIVDPGFKYGTVKEQYNSDGDSFQIMVDFSGKLQDMMINRPEDYESLSNGMCIFYSFDCDGDGAALNIKRQMSDNDMWLNEESTDGAVKGAGSKTETGWCAEFALSWQTLYDDYAWKAYEEDMNIYFGGPENQRFECGLALYYLNCEPDSNITWAAGTLDGQKDRDGTAIIEWNPMDCGIHLYLEYEEGMEFTSPNMIVLSQIETEPPTLPETAPVESETLPETAQPETEALPETETEAPLVGGSTDHPSSGGSSGGNSSGGSATGKKPSNFSEFFKSWFGGWTMFETYIGPGLCLLMIAALAAGALANLIAALMAVVIRVRAARPPKETGKKRKRKKKMA